METLEYHTPVAAPKNSWMDICLPSLPLFASGLAFLSFIAYYREPFGVFAVEDAMIFIGSPALITISLGVWWVIARRRRLAGGSIGAVALWFILMLWVAVSHALS